LLFEFKYQIRWNLAIDQCVFVFMASMKCQLLIGLSVLHARRPMSAVTPYIPAVIPSSPATKNMRSASVVCLDQMNVSS